MTTQISRRGFISAAAGFAGLGFISGIPFPLAPKLPEIDLMRFCCDVSSRYKLDVPFSQGGVTYATDGRIAVRTGLIAAPATTDDARLPDMGKLWWDTDPKWSPWPKQKFIQGEDRISCCDGNYGPDNCRWATRNQQNQNKRAKSAGRVSRFRGVSKHKCGLWTAQIEADKVACKIGYFGDEEEAARAYDRAAMELHGEFARTNFNDETPRSWSSAGVPFVA